MATLENLKNRLIDRILVERNEKLLSAIEEIFNSTQEDEKLELSSEQIEMLLMSEKDIRENNLISEEDVRKSDAEWMS